MELESGIIDQLRRLQTLMHRTAFQSFREHSAYRGQGKVLSILKQRGEISRSELEEQLGISRQGLNELLGKLEKNGLILRAPSQSDRRAVSVRLTEQGLAAAGEREENLHPLTGLLACLSEEEQRTLSHYLERILAAQRDAGQHCAQCRGPEYCSRDYLKYGHSKPNPAYCKYIHLFTESACDGRKSPEGDGEL